MSITEIKIIKPQNKMDWDDYYNIRFEVLRKPWNQSPESTKDEFEDISIHYLVRDIYGKAIGAGRLQINSDQEGQVRSMAVLNSYQGKGIGAKLLIEIEKEARQRRLNRIILDARENAVSFYLKNGYIITDTSYLLFGVIPHFRMEKELI